MTLNGGVLRGAEKIGAPAAALLQNVQGRLVRKAAAGTCAYAAVGTGTQREREHFFLKTLRLSVQRLKSRGPGTGGLSPCPLQRRPGNLAATVKHTEQFFRGGLPDVDIGTVQGFSKKTGGFLPRRRPTGAFRPGKQAPVKIGPRLFRRAGIETQKKPKEQKTKGGGKSPPSLHTCGVPLPPSLSSLLRFAHKISKFTL